MAQVNLPMTLGVAYWDKQKSALAKASKVPATKLPDELKQLTKQHLALDWNAFSGDKLGSADDVKARLGELEDAVKGKIKTLLAQAQAVETAASDFESDVKKDKTFPKEPLTALTAIIKAAKDYRSDVDDAVAAARKALAAKAAEIAAQKPKGGSADAKQLKIAKSRLLTAIATLRKPQPNPRPMRFLIVQGKLTVTVALAYAVGTAQEKLLKSLLPGEAPFKVIKDKTAVVVWEKNALTFVSDRLPSGVVKKVQLWLKKVLKLNLKLRVRKTTGEVEETEGEDIPEDQLKQDPNDVEDAVTGDEFMARLAELQPGIKTGLAGASQARVKALLDSIMQLAKAGKHGDADAELDELEALLEEGEASESAESEGEDKAHGAKGVSREDFTERLTALQPDIKLGLAGASQERVKKLVDEVMKLAKAGKYDDADSMLTDIETLLERAARAMDEWKARRAAAMASLKAVAGKVAAAKHASSTKAIIEIQAVVKNLTAEPASLQQVNELQRWLGSDEVVNDVCELAEDIRTPLLGALSQLRAVIAA